MGKSFYSRLLIEKFVVMSNEFTNYRGCFFICLKNILDGDIVWIDINIL